MTNAVDGVSQRRFQMHPRLLLDVIQRQAGSLYKAVLEGVMNSIDAGATRVDVTYDSNTVTIEDDGKGFRSEEEIEKFFETFGTPPEEGERKTYGYFRMGRGQMMAFGANHWRTGKFCMDVDVKNNGLDYKLKTNMPNFAGCRIDITLYRKMEGYEHRSLEDDLKTAVRWTWVPVFVNGRQLSNNPDEHDWDLVNDDFYASATDTEMMRIYNLGVFVNNSPASHFGTGGTIVSRKQLKMNFARNDILDDCEVWTKIRKEVLRVWDGKSRDKKKPLKPAQKKRLIQLWLRGQLSDEDMCDLPLVEDVRGRWYSLKQLNKTCHRFRNIITSSDKHDVLGDKLIQMNLAMCLANSSIIQFDCDSIADFVKKVIKKATGYDTYEVGDFKRLTGELHDTHELIEEKKWTPLERAILMTAVTAAFDLRRGMQHTSDDRRILLGNGGCADGWTNGSDYIVIDRKFLQRVGTGITGWMNIGLLLIHEYCHGEASSGSHNHSPEFYEMYHEYTHSLLGEFVTTAIGRFENNLGAANRRLTRQQLKERDRVSRVGDKTNQLEKTMAGT